MGKQNKSKTEPKPRITLPRKHYLIIPYFYIGALIYMTSKNLKLVSLSDTNVQSFS